MSLIKWTPLLSDFSEFEKEFNNMLPALKGSKLGFTPAIDIYEDKNNIVVETQLAGIDPEKVNISIDNNTLCIKGESEKKSEIDEKNYYRKEIRQGSFYRSIPLPTEVNHDKAEAITEDGILKITLPKAHKSKSKNIKIKTKKK